MAPLTTISIGGSGRYFIECDSERTVLDGLNFAEDRGLPLLVLGGGSNVLVADAGFPGLVLRIGVAGIAWNDAGDAVVIDAGAGEAWDPLVAECVARELAGIECLSGIPGSVGGTPVQNVGAYGQEVSEVLDSVRAYDRRGAQIVELSRSECRFEYRKSIFNTAERNRYIVLRVRYRLKKAAPATTLYADIRRYFQARRSPPGLSEVRDAVRSIRASKAMLLVEGDPDCRSAGSFFKNPVVTEMEFAAIEAAASGLGILRRGETVPRYPAGPGRVKTAAAWLIERSGFEKGYVLGPAGLSSKHTLAIVNRGGATAGDVLKLARAIRNRVQETFGVRLVAEPVLVGFDRETQLEFNALPPC